MLPKIACILFLLGNASAQACDQGAALKIFSYNVHRSDWTEIPKYWAFRKADVMRLVREAPADIYSFQEMDPDQAADIATVLPEHQSVQVASHLFLFYRPREWQTFHTSAWRDSKTMEAGRLILRPSLDSQRPWMELWSVWIDRAQTRDDREVAWFMDDILAGGQSRPGLLSLSLRAPVDHLHEAPALAAFQNRWHLRQAAPDTFRRTTNGWWGEVRMTADWHDAVFAHESYALTAAARVTTRVAGSYPSTHFPLLTEYCLGAQQENLLAAGRAE